MITSGPQAAQGQFKVVLPPAPYPGLRPFQKDEWPIFFGRERMADDIVDRLIQQHFVVIHGDSGCGKSSLLRAGVLSRLEQESADGGLTWRTGVTQPRDAPLNNLAVCLAGLVDQEPDAGRILEFRRVLNFGGDAPRALTRLLGIGDTNNCCILIDQFEELFAFAKRRGPEEATLLVQFLVALLKQPQPGLHIALTMRSEFLGVCAQFSGLAEAVNEAQYLLPRMTQHDLMRAIREPATLYRGLVSVDLAERLILDAGGAQDELPLIQHGLMTLHRRKAGPSSAPTTPWRLDLSDYTRVDGGLGVLLSNHADEVCRGADMAPLGTIETLFRALTDINAEGQAIRRPQTLGSLAAVTGEDEATLRSALDAFRADGASFVSPFGSTPIDDTTLVDISHEALIRCWHKIADPKEGWLQREFRDGLVWRSLLVQADSFERNPSNILSPATAEERDAWLTRRSSAWADRYGGGWRRVSQLVKKSVEAGRLAVAAERKSTRNQFWLAVAVAGLLLGLSLFATFQNKRTTVALERANRMSASSLWNRLDFNSARATDNDELNALWELALSHDSVKGAFLDELIKNPRRIEKFAKRPVPVARALFLRWPAASADALGQSLGDLLKKTSEPAQIAALAAAIQGMGRTLTPAQGKDALAGLLRGVEGATTPTSARGLASAIPAVIAITNSPAALDGLRSVLGVIPSTTNVNQLQLLETAAKELSRRLESSEARAVLPSVSDALGATTRPEQLRILDATLAALAPTLGKNEVQAVLGPLIDRQILNREPNSLAAMVLDLGADNLTATQAETALSQLTKAIPEIASTDEVDATELQRTIGLANQRLAKQIPADRLQGRAAPLQAMVPRATSEQMLAVGPSFLAVKRNNLTGAEAETLVRSLLRAMKDTYFGEDFGVLAAVMSDASLSLNAAQTSVLASQILRQIQEPAASEQLTGLSAVFRTLSPRLAAEQLEATLKSIIRAGVEGEDPDPLGSLARDLTERLTPRQAENVLTFTLSLIPRGDTTRRVDAYDRLDALTPGLQAIAAKAPAELCRTAVATILRTLPKTLPAKATPGQSAAALTIFWESWATRARLVRAIGRDEVSADDARKLVGPALRALPDTTNAAHLRALGGTVAALGNRLTPPERLSALQLVLKARSAPGTPLTSTIPSVSLGSSPLAIAQAARSLVTDLPTTEADAALNHVLNAIGAATDPGQLQLLEIVLRPLVEQQPAVRMRELTHSLLGWCRAPDQCADWAKRLVALLKKDSASAGVGEIVLALKYPSASRAATDVLLDALKSISPGAPGMEKGLDANIDWISTTYPAIQLGRLSFCPPPLNGAALSCPVPVR